MDNIKAKCISLLSAISIYRRASLIHIILVSILTFAVYANTFDSPFRVDSTTSITENPVLVDISYFTDDDKAPKGYGRIIRGRTTGYLTLFLNYQVHGTDVTGYHLVNTLIHVLAALTLYWLVLLTFRTPVMKGSRLAAKAPTVALLAALVFALHPVQTQSVTYVIQRLASLATLFYALAIAAYVRSRLSEGNAGKTGFYLLCLVSAFLAMKTKETAFTIPMAVMLYEFMFFRDGWKRRVLWLMPVILMLAVIPISLLAPEGEPLGEVLRSVDRSTRITEIPRFTYFMTELRVLVTYLRLMLLPLNQSLFYAYPLSGSLLHPQVLISVLVLGVFLGSGIYCAFRAQKGEPALGIMAFGVFFFFIALSVESGVIPLNPIYEHRLYLPLLGIAPAASVALMLAKEKLGTTRARKAAFAAMILVPALLALFTFTRNAVWASPVAFWGDTVRKAPGEPKTHTGLGHAISLYEPERLRESLSHFHTALRMNPNDFQAHFNLASAYEELGDLDRAVSELETCISLRPGVMWPYVNLASIYEQLGKTVNAMDVLMRAIEREPNYYKTHFNLGNLHLNSGEYEKAVEQYRLTTELDPANPFAYNNMGFAHARLGLMDKAIVLFQKAAELDQDFALPHINMGQAAYERGDHRQAIAHLTRAVTLKHRSPFAHYLLGLSYYREGRYLLSEKHLETAAEMDPAFLPGLKNPVNSPDTGIFPEGADTIQ
jgi:tetratricopeptide (TPR) repeat protein